MDDNKPNWSLRIQDYEFPVRIEEDGSGICIDVQGAYRTRPELMKTKEFLFLEGFLPGQHGKTESTEDDLGPLVEETMLTPEVRRQREKERSEFIIDFTIPVDLASRLRAFTSLDEHEASDAVTVSASDEDTLAALDRELEPIFWEQINPFLSNPLPRKATS